MGNTVLLPTHGIPANPGDTLNADPSNPHGASFGPPVGSPVVVPSGAWQTLGMDGVISTLSFTTLNGLEVAMPFKLDRATTFKSFGIHVVGTPGTAGSVVRIGIRSDSGSGIPHPTAAPIVDLGTQPTTAAGFIPYAPPGGTITLPPGFYWRTVTAQGAPATGPTLRVSTSGDPRWPIYTSVATPVDQAYWGYAQAGVNGALPNGFAPTTYTQTPVRVWGQVN